MTKFFTIAAAAVATFAVATPALAASNAFHFSRDGSEYVASVEQKDGYALIVGRNETTGQRFSLRVANGQVVGDYDGRKVAFAGSLPAAPALAAAN